MISSVYKEHFTKVDILVSTKFFLQLHAGSKLKWKGTYFEMRKELMNTTELKFKAKRVWMEQLSKDKDPQINLDLGWRAISWMQKEEKHQRMKAQETGLRGT